MVKRISLVWRRPALSAADFRRIWLGDHVEYAKQLPGLREYVIDFIEDAPPGAPAGIATVRFDSRAAVDAAFAIPGLKENLLRTREAFAASAQVLFVDEAVIVGKPGSAVR